MNSVHMKNLCIQNDINRRHISLVYRLYFAIHGELEISEPFANLFVIIFK